nr:MAG TPA: hypothetical protein [Caudoviricetes sp.]DAT28776.1 MAG TPA: hypothetical protein [Caudoviricetes sp.]
MKEVGGKGINLDASIVVEITLKELIEIRDSISLVGWSTIQRAYNWDKAPYSRDEMYKILSDIKEILRNNLE